MTSDLRDQLQRTLGAAYTLQSELGGGGMSRVFVADETRLGRKVVVKLLSPELAAGVSVERFEREIRLAAALQQANIVPLLSAGDMDGLPYYTMPLVDGLSLRARLARNGALPVAAAVSVLRNVARALAYAHERGIVHRDIKPDNILLSGDAAVVTDFGIAKALSAARAGTSDSTLTQGGTSIGTPAYMAPEQAAGDPATDHRADLYALGCVAYEMSTGKAPFAGRPPHEMFAAHLSETPPALGTLRPEVPRGLSDLVMRCLEKAPERRPQSAREFLQALDAVPSGAEGVGAAAGRRRVAGSLAVAAAVLVAIALGVRTMRRDAGAATPDGGLPSAVAVLPFVNASGDTSSNYFADGMTDELATALAKVPGLRVVSRTSSYAFRHHDGLDTPTIASRLHAGAIVEGTVRRAGDQLRITAQLSRASDGQSMWADAFSAGAGDVFAVQSRLTQAIVAAVAPVLGGRAAPPPAAAREAANPGTSDPLAYDTYLRARFELNRRGDGVQRSIVLFNQVLARDPRFASAWAGLASAWALIPYYRDGASARSVIDSVRTAYERTMALDSLDGEAYTAYGFALAELGEVGRGLPLQERGVVLDQRSAIARLWLARSNRLLGRYDVEERVEREAMALDPLSGIVISNLAMTVSRDPRRAAEARALARRSVAVDPLNSGTIVNAASALIGTRDFTEALALIDRARPLGGVALWVEASTITALVATGKQDSAAVLLHEFDHAARTPRDLEALATGAAALGQWERAFAAAGDAITSSPSTLMFADEAAVWRPVVRDPRLRALCLRTPANCDAALAVIAATPALRP